MKRLYMLLVAFMLIFAGGCTPKPLIITSTLPPTDAPTIAHVAPTPSPTPTLTQVPPTSTPQPKLPLLLQKGPYLLFTGEPGEMRLMWQSEKQVDYSFAWGIDTMYSSGLIAPTVDVKSRLYRVDLKGLIPGTHYYFRISTSQEETRGDFYSASTDSSNLVFYAFGDTRSGPATHNMIAASILSQMNAEPDVQTFVVSTGDLMDYADEQNLQENEFSLEQSRIRILLASFPVVNVIGNHDDLTLFKKYFPYPYTPKNDWSFDYGPAHFTIINQYFDLVQGSKRWKWLRDDLSTSTKPWKFILLHEPGWSAGPHDNNQMVQEIIQPLAEKFGVSMVIAGHNHYYARAVVNRVVHLTTGGGGAPLYTPGTGWPWVEKTIKAYHYVKLEITGNTLRMQVISPQGDVLDEYSIINQENP